MEHGSLENPRTALSLLGSVQSALGSLLFSLAADCWIVHDQDLKRVWNQRQIPVVVRRVGKGQRLRVRLPYALTNREWLQNGRRTAPVWIADGKYWELPKAWFNDFVDRALAKFGRVYVMQPYREQEKCAPACQNAVGHECECSCMGRHHGAGNDGSWFEVSETFATRWGDWDVACRLMAAK